MTIHDFPSIINESLSHTYIGKLIMFFHRKILSFVDVIPLDMMSRVIIDDTEATIHRTFCRLKTIALIFEPISRLMSN